MQATRIASKCEDVLYEDIRVKLAPLRTGIKQSCVLALLVTATIACAPVVTSHGYFPRTAEILTVAEGSHSQRQIELMLGSPSTIGSFDDNTWYYINTQSHSFAWKAPVIVAEQVLAIKFDSETKMVKSVNQYSIKDGRVIAFSDDVTPTRGRELSFLEQLIGNVGRVSADQLEQQTGGDR